MRKERPHIVPQDGVLINRFTSKRSDLLSVCKISFEVYVKMMFLNDRQTYTILIQHPFPEFQNKANVNFF